MITVEVLADSVSEAGKRITTFRCTYPRFIHAEVKTHRMLSTSSASSRAIPLKKNIELVREDMAYPSAWPKEGKGMAALDLLSPKEAQEARRHWQMTGLSAMYGAEYFRLLGLHKQVANRVIEPWLHITTIITATEWDNFFSLRVSLASQPEFFELAYKMLEQYVQGEPQVVPMHSVHAPMSESNLPNPDRLVQSVARCARVSYKRDEVRTTYEEDAARASQLLVDRHWGPFEHQAFPLGDPNWQSGNFLGWQQYRKQFSGESGRGVDLKALLDQGRKIAQGRGIA